MSNNLKGWLLVLVIFGCVILQIVVGVHWGTGAYVAAMVLSFAIIVLTAVALFLREDYSRELHQSRTLMATFTRSFTRSVRNRPHVAPCIIAAAMALAATAELPYGYYTLMRLVVCPTAIYMIVVAIKSNKMWGVWLFGILALVFNPVVPVHLTKGLWRSIDLIAAVILGVAGFTIQRCPRGKTGPSPI